MSSTTNMSLAATAKVTLATTRKMSLAATLGVVLSNTMTDIEIQGTDIQGAHAIKIRKLQGSEQKTADDDESDYMEGLDEGRGAQVIRSIDFGDPPDEGTRAQEIPSSVQSQIVDREFKDDAEVGEEPRACGLPSRVDPKLIIPEHEKIGTLAIWVFLSLCHAGDKYTDSDSFDDLRGLLGLGLIGEFKMLSKIDQFAAVAERLSETENNFLQLKGFLGLLYENRIREYYTDQNGNVNDEGMGLYKEWKDLKDKGIKPSGKNNAKADVQEWLKRRAINFPAEELWKEYFTHEIDSVAPEELLRQKLVLEENLTRDVIMAYCMPRVIALKGKLPEMLEGILPGKKGFGEELSQANISVLRDVVREDEEKIKNEFEKLKKTDNIEHLEWLKKLVEELEQLPQTDMDDLLKRRNYEENDYGLKPGERRKRF